MAGTISTLWLASTVAGTTPQPLTIWKQIKLVKKILEFIGEVPEWVNYNRNLEEYLQNLKRNMESLQSVESDVITELENTENQEGKKRKREVDHWLRCVKSKAFDIQKVDNDFNRVCYLPRFLFRAWIGSCIKQEIEQINDLQKQKDSFSTLLLDAPRGCRTPFNTNVLIGEVAIGKLEEIWAHVINPVTVMIGVQGVEGVGKSAMTREVYNRLCPFGSVYYVEVPETCDVYSLQASIAKEMKAQILKSKGAENQRAARISQMLKNMKDYVLILDGLSHYIPLDKVGIPTEVISGKIIVTSRYMDVCNRMLCKQTVVLEPLSKEDSVSLFKEKLSADAPLSEEIWKEADKIIVNCNGIPSRIIDMAVQLRGVSDVNEWKCTLSDMRIHSVVDKL